MKNVFVLFSFFLLLFSCSDNFKREYYSNGKVKKEYYLKNGLLNGRYKEFYPSGNLKFIHNYIDNKNIGISSFYSDDKDSNLLRKVFWENDSIGEEVIYSKKGIIISKGKILFNNITRRFGKWNFNNSKTDSIVEYVYYKSEQYVNQIWTLNKKNGDTMSDYSNYFYLKSKDTVRVNEVARFKFILVEPYYNYNSDIEVILPVNDRELLQDYSNIDSIEKDVFSSLKNDGIPHPEIPDWYPKNHVIEFGLIYDEPGTYSIRGLLIEYETDTTKIGNKRVERPLLFEKEFYVRE